MFLENRSYFTMCCRPTIEQSMFGTIGNKVALILILGLKLLDIVWIKIDRLCPKVVEKDVYVISINKFLWMMNNFILLWSLNTGIQYRRSVVSCRPNSIPIFCFSTAAKGQNLSMGLSVFCPLLNYYSTAVLKGNRKIKRKRSLIAFLKQTQRLGSCERIFQVILTIAMENTVFFEKVIHHGSPGIFSQTK